MASGVVEVGCMVNVAATFFDDAGDHVKNRWSFGLFGNEWETARYMGKVIRVTQGGKWCLVQWSIDGTVTRIPAWSQRPVNSSNGLPEDQTHLTYLNCHLSYLQFTLPFFFFLYPSLSSAIEHHSFFFFLAQKPNSMHKTRHTACPG